METKKMIKVLHVYRTYFPDTQGGLEEALRQICMGSGGDGIEHRVFTVSRSANPPVLNRPEAEVHRVPLDFEVASCDFSLRGIGEFRRLAAEADIVHFQFPWPFGDMLALLLPRDKPVVITYQSDVVRQRGLLMLYRPLMNWFLRRANVVVTTTENYARSSEVLPAVKDKLRIVPLGLDESVLPAIDDAKVVEVEEQVGRDFFLFVGVLRYYKGLHTLLEAVAGTELRVVVAGDGPENSNLRRQAKELGADNVTFLGRVSDEDKIALYRLARGVVFPSHLRSEAYGVTLLEGLAMGKALISTELGTGTSFVNLHDESGLVIQPSDPRALRDAMRTLACDDALVARYGEGGRARFERLFTPEVTGARYREIYRSLVDGG